MPAGRASRRSRSRRAAVDQTLDLLGGQVLAGAALGMRDLLGQNCPILRGWRGGLGRGAAHRTRALAHTQLSHFGSDTVGEWVGRIGVKGVRAAACP